MIQGKNHLAGQTSPYLIQHADNPVEWYPWSNEALERARHEDKPILLSIGYSACHWCHVMAHESFEDETTAKMMNELFINIKIDREERPDIDKIYQTAQFVLTQRTGGWPLTMFLTPDDQMPFFGGTYFPNEARHGLPAFKDLLQHISKVYQDRRAEITAQNQSIQSVLQKIHEPTYALTDLSPDLFKICNQQIEQAFDVKDGGFGPAPKFPHTTHIERLLRYYTQSISTQQDSPRSLHAAIFTLEKMAAGGLFDHLGGGFCRYSVDSHWMIPHFEKMLYDNGPLLALYAQGFALTRSEQFKNVCEATAQWVIREMQSPEGGYYSSIDADSEGSEGKYYAWDRDQIKQVLDDDEYAVFSPHYGLDRNANFEGRYHLHTFVGMDAICQQAEISEENFKTLIRLAKHKLLSQREKRIHPDRDEKILSSWNALMIRGMAIAGRILERTEYIESAQRSLEFLRNRMWSHQHLTATYKDGISHLDAYLDDYSFLLDAILEMLQVRWCTEDLTWACEIADVLLEKFEDKAQGGFYFTSIDHERLIQRSKTLSDEAMPSGNGIAAMALARLGYLLGNTEYLDATERVLKFAGQAVTHAPMGHASLINAYEEKHYPLQIIILRGRKNDLKKWQKQCTLGFEPRRLVFAIDSDERNLPDALIEKKYFEPCPEGVVAYVCEGMSCKAPITSLAELQSAIADTGNPQ
ncbi:MAG: thioredoxin domain-containing protein [Gammaproteobacteria bacterium]|nr:thioredoxin domain-containing protein [Gammaproteobacteria bacterium]